MTSDLINHAYVMKPPPPPAAAAKLLQSCPTLCDPIDGSPPGFPVPGILQARVLEWGYLDSTEREHFHCCKHLLGHAVLESRIWTSMGLQKSPNLFMHAESSTVQ